MASYIGVQGGRGVGDACVDHCAVVFYVGLPGGYGVGGACAKNYKVVSHVGLLRQGCVAHG